MEEKVLIFGHKNPDTDSICSSIVHEILDKKNGWDTKAVRLGNINKETQYVLDYLGLSVKEIVTVGDGVNDYCMFEMAECSIGVNVKEDYRVNRNCITTLEMLQYLYDII